MLSGVWQHSILGRRYPPALLRPSTIMGLALVAALAVSVASSENISPIPTRRLENAGSGVVSGSSVVVKPSSVSDKNIEAVPSPSAEGSPPPLPPPSPRPRPPPSPSPGPSPPSPSPSSPSLLLFLSIAAGPVIGLCTLLLALADPAYACSALPSLRRILGRTPKIFDQPMDNVHDIAPVVIAAVVLIGLETSGSVIADTLWQLCVKGLNDAYLWVGAVLLALGWVSFITALRSPEAKQYAAINDEDASNGTDGDVEGDVTVREAFVLEESAGGKLTVAALFGDTADTAHALLDVLVTSLLQLGLLMLFGATKTSGKSNENDSGESIAFSIKVLSYVSCGLIMLLKAGGASVNGFRLIHVHARILLLRAARGFSLRCNAEERAQLLASRAPSFALSLLLAALSSLQVVISLFAVEHCVEIVSQQFSVRDAVIGFISLFFILDLEKGWVKSTLFRPFRPTITHKGQVMHLESRGAASHSYVLTAEWRTIAHESAEGGPPAFSKMESYPQNVNFSWQHSQLVWTLLIFRYAIIFCLSQRENLLQKFGALAEPTQLRFLLQHLARIGVGVTLGMFYSDRVARVGKAWQQLLLHLVLFFALTRASIWAGARALDVYGDNSPLAYFCEIVAVVIPAFALACFHSIALGRPCGELEVEHLGQVVMQEFGVGVASWLALCSSVAHFGFSLLPTDALGLLVQMSGAEMDLAAELSLFEGEKYERSGRETLNTTFSAIIVAACVIICYQLGGAARRHSMKLATDLSLGANEWVILAAISCALLGLLGTLVLAGAFGGTSAIPTLALALVSVFGGSFLVAEPLWQGRLYARNSPAESSRSRPSAAPPTKQLIAEAKAQQQAAETSATVAALSDAVLLMLDQMASAKGKPAEVVERLQAVRGALEAVQPQRWPGSGRPSAPGANAFAPPGNGALVAAAPNTPQRCCPDERSRPLGQPPTPQRSGSFPARTGSGSAGKRTPGTTPGGTPRTPKDVQLSSRRWGCAGS